MSDYRVGDKVYFGRAHGEQTLGEVVKINAASIKVKQLESRGSMKAHAIGTIWKVQPSLCRPASAGAVPVVAPVRPPAASFVPVVPTTAKRDDSTILHDIVDCYCGLSPENISCDGEAPAHVVRRRYAELNRRLLVLFNEIGRHVSETEAYGS